MEKNYSSLIKTLPLALYLIMVGILALIAWGVFSHPLSVRAAGARQAAYPPPGSTGRPTLVHTRAAAYPAPVDTATPIPTRSRPTVAPTAIVIARPTKVPSITPTRTNAPQSPTAASRPTLAQTSFPTPTDDSASPALDQEEVVLNPVADTYVHEANPQSNYGGKKVLLINSHPHMVAFLRFDLSSMAGKPIRRIFLRLYLNADTTGALAVRLIDHHNWNEPGTSFANAPQSGRVIFRTRELDGGHWIILDITRNINSAGLLDLMLTTRASGVVDVASRESGRHAPQLVFLTAQ